MAEGGRKGPRACERPSLRIMKIGSGAVKIMPAACSTPSVSSSQIQRMTSRTARSLASTSDATHLAALDL